MDKGYKSPNRKRKTVPEHVHDFASRVFDGMDKVVERVFSDMDEVYDSIRQLIGLLDQGVEKYISPPVRSVIAWLFKVRIPRKIQELGLTESLFLQLQHEFYCSLKALDKKGEAAVERDVIAGKQTFAEGFVRALEHSGWEARNRRAEATLNALIERHNLSDNPEIVAFLKSELLSQPPELG